MAVPTRESIHQEVDREFAALDPNDPNQLVG